MVDLPFEASLTDVKTGLRVVFFPTHTRLPSREGMDEQSWRLLSGGTIRQPRPGGEQPTEHTLTAWLPGGRDYSEPWASIETWRPPRDLMFQLRSWMRAGTELRFLVTETDVDTNIFIASVDKEWGELDRLYFTLTLVELRGLWVEVIAQSGSEPAGASGGARRGRGDMAFRAARAGEPPAPIPDVYTLQTGNTLAGVALLMWGNSGRFGELEQANRDTLAGLDINNLPAGLQLRIPGGSTTDVVLETIQPRLRGIPASPAGGR